MRLSRRHNVVAIVVLVAALLAVALTVICSDGVHLGTGSMDGKCLSMTHTTVVGTEASSRWVSTLLSLAIATVVGARIVTDRGWRMSRAVAVNARVVSPPDPLMGRLRI